MKKLVALLLVLALGYVLFTQLYGPSNMGQLFPAYGQADLRGRVSEAYIQKTVTGTGQEVVFGESEQVESGAANMVTSIVVDYRSFDTLGEVTVLFVSALGVAFVLGNAKQRKGFGFAPSFLLQYGAKLVFPIILVVGVYIFVHGHLTPGGGFPGGSMIASAMLLLYLAEENVQSAIHGFKILEGVAGSVYVIIGLAGVAVGGYFLLNFLPTGTVGTLFSAGIIPIVYVVIGLKVGAELTGLISNFYAEEVEA